MSRIVIKEGSISLAAAMSQELPEFINPPKLPEYEKRLLDVPHLVLIAYHEGMPIGFKVGYEKESYFYSWMGGVLSPYRGRGVAKLLAQRQEQWAREKGYKELVFKTRNQHKAMLIFALKNGFNIVGFTQKKDVLTNRILLKKVL